MTDDNDCPICYNMMDAPYTNPCCKNRFHIDCLRNWYNRSKSCPCCRSKNIRNGPFAEPPRIIPIEENRALPQFHDIKISKDLFTNATSEEEKNEIVSNMMRSFFRQEQARQAAINIRRQAARDAAREAKIAKVQEKARLAAEKAAKKEAEKAAKKEAKEAAKKEAKKAAKLAKEAAKAAKKIVVISPVAIVADPSITLAGQAALRRAAMV